MFSSPPPFFRGGLFFTGLSAILIFYGCAGKTFHVKDAMSRDAGAVLTVAENKKTHGLYTCDGETLRKIFSFPIGVTVTGIQRADRAIVVITEAHGIYLYPDAKEPALHIPVAEGHLAHKKIGYCHYSVVAGERLLYVSYMSREGSGLTVCRISPKWDSVTCETMTAASSDLRSDYIRQIENDARGNIWIRYAEALGLGVTRITPKGAMDHYSKHNSQLGDNGVLLIRAEQSGDGLLDGDYVWFVTKAGLTSMKYSGNKEEWKLYGEKQSTADTLTRAIGVHSWFSDAIVDIVDVAITKGAVIIADKSALYRYDGKDIYRYIPPVIGGIDDIRIGSILTRGDLIIVKTIQHPNTEGVIVGVQIYNRRTRIWSNHKIWEIGRSYPSKVWFIPYKNDEDLVILSYVTIDSQFAIFRHNTQSILPFDIDPEK